MDFTMFRDELWKTILSFKIGLEEIVEPVCKSEGLTNLQTCILTNIKADCPHMITVGELAEHLAASQGNLSAVCKKMEQMGLLIRERSKEDERVVNLKLTPLGEKKIEDIHNKLFNIFVDSKVSPEEYRELLAGFKSLRKLIKNIVGSNLK